MTAKATNRVRTMRLWPEWPDWDDVCALGIVMAHDAEHGVLEFALRDPDGDGEALFGDRWPRRPIIDPAVASQTKAQILAAIFEFLVSALPVGAGPDGGVPEEFVN